MKRVSLIAATREGLLLLGKRNDSGRWTMPGGSLNEGEEPEAGARRELREETSLSPVGGLKLVDERERNGVKFYTFECKVDGTPSGKNDPDNECGTWAFFDIANGIPKTVASNMAGPKEDNILEDLYSLEKMQRLVGFPKLGIEDRRETPYLDSPLQVRSKLESMASAMEPHVRFRPGVPKHKLPKKRDVAIAEASDVLGSSYGAVMSPDPHTNKLGPSFVHTQNTRAGLGMNPGGRNSDVATKLHEDFHQMMARVEQKYGQQARFTLSRNLWDSIPDAARRQCEQFTRNRNRSALGTPFEHEERLAILHNYINDPHERNGFHNRHGHSQVAIDAVGASMKAAMKHLNRTVSQVDERWLTMPIKQLQQQQVKEALKSPPADAVPPAPAPAPVSKKPKAVSPDQLSLFKGCSIAPWDKVSTREQVDEYLNKKEEDDEVDRLLLHPNPAERRMALKLASVRDKHLIRALEDEHPDVQRAAFSHPGMNASVLHALMRMPNREHLQLLGLDHPHVGIGHVKALYAEHYNSGNKSIINAITKHSDLDGPFIDTMYEDGNGSRSLIANLRTPADTIQKIIERNFLPGNDPQSPHRHLVMEALRHPHAPPHLVERALREGDDGIKLAAAISPNLPSGAAEDTLKRGQLPTNHHEAHVRRALVTSPHATERHLMMGLDDTHPRVRAGVLQSASPHLNVKHLDRAIEKGDPHLVGLTMNHPLRTDQHLQSLVADKRPEVRQLGQLYSQKPPALKKFEEDLGLWLQLKKAVKPADFKGIVRASDPAGRDLVDHGPHLDSHSPGDSHLVQAYRDHVLNSPKTVKRTAVKKNDGAEGITRKHLYEVPGHVQSHGGQKFMVKPYHERVIGRVKTWGSRPHRGWAEMAHQSLYHAAGIGHLHQKVHVSEHDMGEDNKKEPALVVALEKDHLPVYELGYSAAYTADRQPSMKVEARKIALMDFLTNNLDRHGANLMMKWNHQEKKADQLLAIDHSRSFQYHNNYDYKHSRHSEHPKEMNDRFGPYAVHSSIDCVAPFLDTRQHDLASRRHQTLKDYAPIFDWWGEVSPKVRAEMTKHLEQIKDDHVRNHVRRNFEARADWLDERENLGLENYGTDWYKDPVPLYKFGQMTDHEKHLTELLERTTHPDDRAVLLSKLGRKE